MFKHLQIYNTVVVAGRGRGAVAATIFKVEADIETVDSALNLDEELILSRAARTSSFIRTNTLPDLHGFCKFSCQKSSLKHLSFDP